MGPDRGMPHRAAAGAAWGPRFSGGVALVLPNFPGSARGRPMSRRQTQRNKRDREIERCRISSPESCPTPPLCPGGILDAVATARKITLNPDFRLGLSFIRFPPEPQTGWPARLSSRQSRPLPSPALPGGVEVRPIVFPAAAKPPYCARKSSSSVSHRLANRLDFLLHRESFGGRPWLRLRPILRSTRAARSTVSFPPQSRSPGPAGPSCGAHPKAAHAPTPRSEARYPSRGPGST